MDCLEGASHLLTKDQLRVAARDTRMRIRSGTINTQTSGLMPGIVQANIAILPHAWAEDFVRYCRLNPRACPLISVARSGEYMLEDLGDGIDIRTDLPRYQVFREGEPVDDPTDIIDIWQDDFVTFVIGCSFSVEEVLLQAGIPLRHRKFGQDVSIFRTTIPTAPYGPFGGPVVVSMRPFSRINADRAIKITSRYPKMHGAPIHAGDPSEIGISDLDAPQWGVRTPMEPDDVPLFWACGVTPQAALAQARLPIAITHKPSHMLITDKLVAEYALG
ncbi:putative hydro-lyase [Microbaculum marinisediminis]